jgi:hypothetical protein
MNMATSFPLAFSSQIPVTPPPDHQTFGKTPLSPQLLKTFAQEVYGVMGGKLQPDIMMSAARSVPMGLKGGASAVPLPIPGLEALSRENHMTQPHSMTSHPGYDAKSAPAVQQHQQHQQQQQQLHQQQQHTATTTTTTPAAEGIDPANDPQYLAMASRIATYYQQRCQAVANYQQQRCQAWANMHRQKCHEMMQAAMLVVAWYIRDRISRKRKRAKRRFKRGLAEKSVVRPKVTKGESVRRWVLDVPSSTRRKPTSDRASGNEDAKNGTGTSCAMAVKEDAAAAAIKEVAGGVETDDATVLNPNLLPVHDAMLDHEEAEFSMDNDTTPDKDTKLFNVADNLIKSQLAKIDVPLLGALSFDESDSESDDDAFYYRPPPQYQDDDEDMVDGEEGEEYYDDDDESYEEDCEDEGGVEYIAEENIGSEEVLVGTGGGSRKRTRSSVS